IPYTHEVLLIPYTFAGDQSVAAEVENSFLDIKEKIHQLGKLLNNPAVANDFDKTFKHWFIHIQQSLDLLSTVMVTDSKTLLDPFSSLLKPLFGVDPGLRYAHLLGESGLQASTEWLRRNLKDDAGAYDEITRLLKMVLSIAYFDAMGVPRAANETAAIVDLLMHRQTSEYINDRNLLYHELR